MAPAIVSNYNNDSSDVIGILLHKLQGDTFYFVKKTHNFNFRPKLQYLAKHQPFVF